MANLNTLGIIAEMELRHQAEIAAWHQAMDDQQARIDTLTKKVEDLESELVIAMITSNDNVNIIDANALYECTICKKHLKSAKTMKVSHIQTTHICITISNAQ